MSLSINISKSVKISTTLTVDFHFQQIMRLNNQKEETRPLIAHVIYRLDTGGLENGLVNIINRMPQAQFRHAIICITDYTDFRKRLEPEVEVIALHKKPGHDIGLYWRMFKIFRQLQPDIVHTRNLAALEAQIPAWLAGVKYRIHGLHGWDISNPAGENETYRRLHQLTSPFIHRYIPLSIELEEYLVDSVGVKGSKIRRICNGVDTDQFHPETVSDLIPDRLKGQFIIGTVGRLEVVKDQLNLVESYIHILAKYPELSGHIALVLVGSGSRRFELQNCIEQAGLDSSVWFAGDRSDVRQLLNTFSVFVLPSKSEGISNSILEAMATGLPVVATDVGGNTQLVDSGRTGRLVPKEDPQALADALYEYISQPDILAEHAIAARQRAVEHFSLNKMVGEYEKVYQNR